MVKHTNLNLMISLLVLIKVEFPQMTEEILILDSSVLLLYNLPRTSLKPCTVNYVFRVPPHLELSRRFSFPSST